MFSCPSSTLMSTLLHNQYDQWNNNNSSMVNVNDGHSCGIKEQHRWSPYSDNGGSVVAIAGHDFSVIASDTRLSTGYSIYTRNQPKLFTLTPNTVLGVTGCWCDVITFTKILEARFKMYRHEHNKVMSTSAAAQLISTMLYHRRFFPYYITNVLIGLKPDGTGTVFSYDPVGCVEEHNYVAGGSSSALLQPLLDNLVGLKNMEHVDDAMKKLSLSQATDIVKDVFISATERDIYCGDSVIIRSVTKAGISEEKFELRKD